jgi:hypothetical protein
VRVAFACAATLSAVEAAAQQKPVQKPGPAAPALHLKVGDELELVERETEVVHGNQEFTATSTWNCSAVVREVREDCSVALALRCDRFISQYKTDYRGELQHSNYEISFDTDDKSRVYRLPNGVATTEFDQLVAAAGRTMTVVLAPDGRVADVDGEIRPPSVRDDRSDAVKAACPRAEAMRFFMALPTTTVREGDVWKYDRWFAPSFFEDFEPVGPFTVTAKARAPSASSFACDLSAASPKRRNKSPPTTPGDTELVEHALRGSAAFDLETGLCSARSESMTAVTDRVYQGGWVKHYEYDVKTEMTCRRRPK